MNIGNDDPRLSAWVLGELSPEESAVVEASLAEHPALLHEAAELQEMASFLSEHLTPVAVQPRVIPFPAFPAPASPIVNVRFARQAPRKKSQTWRHVLTAAAMVALAGFAFYEGQRHPVSGGAEASLQPGAASPASQGSSIVMQASPSIATGKEPHPSLAPPVPGPKLPDADALSQQLGQEALPESWNMDAEHSLASLSEIELPLVVGRKSYDQVRGWILDHNELPPKKDVRIEEIANAFPLPPQQETIAFVGLRVACISVPSPWLEGAQLVGVQIANETKDSRSVTWSFQPGHVARGVRILSSSNGSGKGSSVLPPNQRTLVLIEVASSASDCGALVVSTEGRSRGFPARETQDGGMAQAGLVAAFGLWLRGEGVDDSRLSQILVSAGEDSDPGRADSRRLIRQALNLAAAKRSKR